MLVIMGHSALLKISAYGGGVDYSNLWPSKYIHVGWIYSFHMPFFVFIAGMSYGCSPFRGARGSYLWKKFKRLMIPYLFVSLFWLVPIRLLVGYYNPINFRDILVNGILLGKNSGPLWFLMMLFFLFVFLILFAIDAGRLRWWVWPLAVLLYWYSGACGTSVSWLNKFCELFVFFLLGFVFIQKNIPDYLRNLVPLQMLVAVLSFGVLWMVLLMARDHVFVLAIKRGMMAAAALSAITVLMIISEGLSRLTGVAEKTLDRLDELSLGLYLVHDPLNYLFLFMIARLGVNLTFLSLVWQEFLFVGIRLAFVLIGSLMMIYAFRSVRGCLLRLCKP